jgi:DNA recombination protein RmuC
VLLLRSGGIGQAEAGRLAAEADFTLRQNDDLSSTLRIFGISVVAPRH